MAPSRQVRDLPVALLTAEAELFLNRVRAAALQQPLAVPPPEAAGGWSGLGCPGGRGDWKWIQSVGPTPTLH